MCSFSTHKTHKGCYYIMKVCWESVSLSAGQSLVMNRIMLMWLLIHKTVVFAFYWLHFLYGRILKYLDGSFYIKYNLSSKLFILSLKQPFEFKKFYYYHFTHGKQKYLEYFYILFHQNVKALSEQTCMIRITQHDVKIWAGNPAVIPCYCSQLF